MQCVSATASGWKDNAKTAIIPSSHSRYRLRCTRHRGQFIPRQRASKYGYARLGRIPSSGVSGRHPCQSDFATWRHCRASTCYVAASLSRSRSFPIVQYFCLCRDNGSRSGPDDNDTCGCAEILAQPGSPASQCQNIASTVCVDPVYRSFVERHHYDWRSPHLGDYRCSCICVTSAPSPRAASVPSRRVCQMRLSRGAGGRLSGMWECFQSTMTFAVVSSDLGPLSG